MIQAMNGYEISEMLSNPDHPNIVLSFDYGSFTLELDESEHDGHKVYAVWANHAYGYAMVVPCARSRTEAIKKAKLWVEQRTHLKQ